jgi:hypothetical protein
VEKEFSLLFFGSFLAEEREAVLRVTFADLQGWSDKENKQQLL